MPSPIPMRQTALSPQPSFMSTAHEDTQSLKDEIAELEARLQDAKSRLSQIDGNATLGQSADGAG